MMDGHGIVLVLRILAYGTAGGCSGSVIQVPMEVRYVHSKLRIKHFSAAPSIQVPQSTQ
ncbi:hypothetical protein L873DRAFT_1819726 [Choiromyces venosus 120613-1]|uniref:Uncharacterized protein n=1 Tax=Choiromyces venosus 120613-1 TaxID=1336337 RepID=A0A3N4IZ22_9PEZI|nr:hypothetical protein L873DRAFT_1819726 [Choiromyces venosus 120613-1]